jgi:tRNA/tmRNA/rRNA uracil-C5-methylase (TrmA/RlmC/RlmD family)
LLDPTAASPSCTAYAQPALRDAGIAGGHDSVTGVDIDPEALAVATARAKEEGLDHVRFVQERQVGLCPAINSPRRST